MKQKIGTAIIKYDGNGNVTTAEFKGDLNVVFDKEFTQMLGKGSSQKEIKDNADLALAGWFNTITEIEIGDRVTNPIISEVKTCEKNDEGKIIECQIEYFVEI